MTARIAWALQNATTSFTFTSYVLSASVNIGRQTYMDVYNGGSLMVTLNNNTNLNTSFTMNDEIRLTDPASGYALTFWVDEIQCQDYPGNTGLSTMTLACSDAVARLGRRYINAQTLTATTAALQAAQFDNGTFPSIVAASGVSDGSQVSGTVYTGAPMQRINQLISTDRGVILLQDKTLKFVSRTGVNDLPLSSISFGRSATTTQIGYQEFSRVALGQNFMNTVTVTPTGGADQVAENAASVATYGSSYYSVSSEDATNAQALGLAEWLANSQSDPLAIRFEVTFSDRSQNATALASWPEVLQTKPRCIMNWRYPSTVVDAQMQVIAEGYQFDITPGETRFRVYFSPMAYYQFFTLDSSTLGILDTSRLGW